MTRLLDLSNPQTLRELMGTDPSQFFVEFSGNSGSDIEDADEETVPVRDRNVPATHRTPLDLDDDEDEEQPIPQQNQNVWRPGATTPEPLQFIGNQGMTIEMESDSTPLDYFRLMVDDSMMEHITRETNR
ncbi:hypothetical protein PoB_002005400 [Plakobranchus ocellatus]|uniref:Uncharacterized protein n=1 Tax=Plakobranchus ocellatus TaxID=259542 RepID=A0AAV3ZI39_9GAST|nr:hypothetical protein PoB_002005400 [Plakobranchus ocellatus]